MFFSDLATFFRELFRPGMNGSQAFRPSLLAENLAVVKGHGFQTGAPDALARWGGQPCRSGQNKTGFSPCGMFSRPHPDFFRSLPAPRPHHSVPGAKRVPQSGTTVEAPAFRPGNTGSQTFRPSGPENFYAVTTQKARGKTRCRCRNREIGNSFARARLPDRGPRRARALGWPAVPLRAKRTGLSP
jgi:hypothetical protein